MIEIKSLQELEDFLLNESYSITAKYTVFEKVAIQYFGNRPALYFVDKTNKNQTGEIIDTNDKLLNQMISSVRNLINPDKNYREKIYLIFRK